MRPPMPVLFLFCARSTEGEALVWQATAERSNASRQRQDAGLQRQQLCSAVHDLQRDVRLLPPGEQPQPHLCTALPQPATFRLIKCPSLLHDIRAEDAWDSYTAKVG